MKNLTVICLFLWAMPVFAQQETLFDDFDIRGGFGGPILEIGSINGEVGADVGGGGALLINNFFLGGYGMGTSYPDYRINNRDYNIQFKHGGFWLGYALKESKLVHLYSSVKIGWGKARLRRDGKTDYSDSHFALTPELGLEINLFDWCKMGLTGGYRLVNGINTLPGLKTEDFNSPIGVITFRFGGFDNDWD